MSSFTAPEVISMLGLSITAISLVGILISVHNFGLKKEFREEIEKTEKLNEKLLHLHKKFDLVKEHTVNTNRIVIQFTAQNKNGSTFDKVPLLQRAIFEIYFPSNGEELKDAVEHVFEYHGIHPDINKTLEQMLCSLWKANHFADYGVESEFEKIMHRKTEIHLHTASIS